VLKNEVPREGVDWVPCGPICCTYEENCSAGSWEAGVATLLKKYTITYMEPWASGLQYLEVELNGEQYDLVKWIIERMGYEIEENDG